VVAIVDAIGDGVVKTLKAGLVSDLSGPDEALAEACGGFIRHLAATRSREVVRRDCGREAILLREAFAGTPGVLALAAAAERSGTKCKSANAFVLAGISGVHRLRPGAPAGRLLSLSLQRRRAGRATRGQLAEPRQSPAGGPRSARARHGLHPHLLAG